MEIALIALTFVLSLGTSILSGMSGGGGGFIMTPYLIFIGLSPASALATVKFNSLGTTAGSIAAFKGKGLVRKNLLAPFLTITLICALISAWLIPQIDPGLFQKVIGVVLLLLIPTLFIKKASLQPGARSQKWLVGGFIAYTIFSFLQTLIGTGIGSILVVVLMLLFGLNALEASATKRITQLSQAVVLFVLLALQGLVVWTHGVAGFAGAVIGSHLGTRVALKRGVGFVKFMLAAAMAISGVALLL